MKIFALTLIVVLSTSPLPALAAAEHEEDKATLAEQMLELWPVEKKALAVSRNTGSQVLRNASSAIQGRLPVEKHEAVMVEVGVDVSAYLDEVTPIVSQSAGRLKSPMFLPFLLDNFSAAELEELVNMLQSPVIQKFERLAPAMQRRYELKVIEESGDKVNSHLAQLTDKVNERLTTAVNSQ